MKKKTNCLHSAIRKISCGTAILKISYDNDVTVRLLCSSTEENWSALFYWLSKIEIKYLSSWLLQNNFLGVQMLFEIEKPRLKPLFFYLNNISPPQRLFCKHKDTCFIFLKIQVFYLKNCSTTHIYYTCSWICWFNDFCNWTVTFICFRLSWKRLGVGQ